MGYGIYFQEQNNRWAGYMVPGECDLPECENRIHLSMDAKCNEHEEFDDEGELLEVVEDSGCGWFFCSDHSYDAETHVRVTTAKPDCDEWVLHLLGHESWAEWRAQNPDAVLKYEIRVLTRS